MIKFLCIFILATASLNAFSDELDQISVDIDQDVTQQLKANEAANKTIDLTKPKETSALDETNRTVAAKDDFDEDDFADDDIAGDIENSIEDDEFDDGNIDDDIQGSLEDDELRPANAQSQKNKSKTNFRGKITPYSKEEKLIDHPNASKGLYKITKDLDYLYKIEKSPQNHSASVRFGMFDPVNLATEDRQFFLSDLYDSSSAPMVLIDYEWQYKFLGKFSLKAGTGIYFNEGNGRFNTSVNTQGAVPLEDFSLFMLPNSLNAVYKLQFWDEQWIVPYAEAGLDAFTFMEFQDGESFPRFGGSIGAHFAFGGALALNFLDRWSLLNLDRDYGINTVSLVGEFRNYLHITGAFDFSGTVINGGIALDF